MIVVTDLLRTPFDEGAKNTAYNIISCLGAGEDHDIISINGSDGVGVDVELHIVNKAFINIGFLSRLRTLSHDSILYVPESSSTIFSLIRAKLINIFTGNPVCILALQPRRFSRFKKFLVKFIKPKMIVTPSKSYESYLREAGLNCVSIPLGVNDELYVEYDNQKKLKLRQKFNIAEDKTVILHVGHICSSRNLEWLVEVKRCRPDIEVLIIGSTYNESDHELGAMLKSHEIIVMSQYIDNMAEIYNLANYYVFPVLNDQGAIATPLSVLEAMSCNVPIMSTKFGSLIDIFSPDNDFHFIEGSADILSVLAQDSAIRPKCVNRVKVESYAWKNIARKIENIMEH